MMYEGSSNRPASPGNPKYHWRCRDFALFLQFPRGPHKVIIREYRATKMTLVWFPVQGKREKERLPEAPVLARSGSRAG